MQIQSVIAQMKDFQKEVVEPFIENLDHYLDMDDELPNEEFRKLSRVLSSAVGLNIELTRSIEAIESGATHLE